MLDLALILVVWLCVQKKLLGQNMQYNYESTASAAGKGVKHGQYKMLQEQQIQQHLMLIMEQLETFLKAVKLEY